MASSKITYVTVRQNIINLKRWQKSHLLNCSTGPIMPTISAGYYENATQLNRICNQKMPLSLETMRSISTLSNRKQFFPLHIFNTECAQLVWVQQYGFTCYLSSSNSYVLLLELLLDSSVALPVSLDRSFSLHWLLYFYPRLCGSIATLSNEDSFEYDLIHCLLYLLQDLINL